MTPRSTRKGTGIPSSRTYFFSRLWDVPAADAPAAGAIPPGEPEVTDRTDMTDRVNRCRVLSERRDFSPSVRQYLDRAVFKSKLGASEGRWNPFHEQAFERLRIDVTVKNFCGLELFELIHHAGFETDGTYPDFIELLFAVRVFAGRT